MNKKFKILIVILIAGLVALFIFGCENNVAPVSSETDTYIRPPKPCFVLIVWTDFGSETFYSLHAWTDSKARLLYILNTDSCIINVSLDELKDFDVKVGNY